MKTINELLGSKKGFVSHLFTQFPRFTLDSEGLGLLGIQETVSSIIKAFEIDKIDENHTRALLKSICLSAITYHSTANFTA
jgi:hypothetical protein